jgi:hypothetical protein
MPGPTAREADNRIKDAGYRRKQKAPRKASKGVINPLISPKDMARAAPVPGAVWKALIIEAGTGRIVSFIFA